MVTGSPMINSKIGVIGVDIVSPVRASWRFWTHKATRAPHGAWAVRGDPPQLFGPVHVPQGLATPDCSSSPQSPVLQQKSNSEGRGDRKNKVPLLNPFDVAGLSRQRLSDHNSEVCSNRVHQVPGVTDFRSKRGWEGAGAYYLDYPTLCDNLIKYR